MKKTLILLAVLAMVAPTFGAAVLFEDNFDSYSDGQFGSGTGYEPGPWSLQADKPGVTEIVSGELKASGGEADGIWATGQFSADDAVDAIVLSFDLTYNGREIPTPTERFIRMVKGVDSVLAVGLSATTVTDLSGTTAFIGAGESGYGSPNIDTSDTNAAMAVGQTRYIEMSHVNGVMSVYADGELLGSSAYGPEANMSGVSLFAFRDQGDWTVDNMVVTQVPEPATMTLLALGGLGALIRRKRR